MSQFNDLNMYNGKSQKFITISSKKGNLFFLVAIQTILVSNFVERIVAEMVDFVSCR